MFPAGETQLNLCCVAYVEEVGRKPKKKKQNFKVKVQLIIVNAATMKEPERRIILYL